METVKLQGPKRELVLAAFENAFAGAEGSGSIIEGEAGRGIDAIADNDTYLRTVIAFIADANQRTDGLWESLLHAAASDAVVQVALTEMLASRQSEYRRIIGILGDRGMLSSPGDHRALAGAMSFLLSPESYQQLVREAGWSMPDYRDWLLRATRALVLAAQ